MVGVDCKQKEHQNIGTNEHFELQEIEKLECFSVSLRTSSICDSVWEDAGSDRDRIVVIANALVTSFSNLSIRAWKKY